MSTTKKSSDDQEIDLADISRKVGSAYHGFNAFLFSCIQFVIRNAIVLTILLAIGIGLGIYLDRTQKSYDHQIVVRPNFGSVDYLYSKVDLLNSKIREKDYGFLSANGFKNSHKISKIKIEPVVDVYGFISQEEQNFQIFKLMAEDGDIKKIIEENPTSKNYPYHVISFSTKTATSQANSVTPLMNYLNNSEYYRKIQKTYVQNVHLKMLANDKTIEQIDGILSGLGANSGVAKGSNVYINENTQLNDVIKTKDELVQEQGNHRIDLLNLEKIIKDTSATINIEDATSVNGKMKIILPLLFIGLFVMFSLFRRFYRSQSIKAAARISR